MIFQSQPLRDALYIMAPGKKSFEWERGGGGGGAGAGGRGGETIADLLNLSMIYSFFDNQLVVHKYPR